MPPTKEQIKKAKHIHIGPRMHHPINGDKPIYLPKIEEKPVAHLSLKRFVEEPTLNDMYTKEVAWLQAVENAKRAVSDLHKARRIISQEALRVCEIQQGGGAHWSGHEGVYTVRRFAKEVGVNYKTLWTWISVERDLVSSLNPGEYKEADYKYAHRALKRNRGNREKMRDDFRALRDSQKKYFKLSTIVQWARSHWGFVRSTDLAELPEKELQALRDICQQTASVLDAHLKNRTRQ